MTDTPTPKPQNPKPHLILASQSPRRAQLLRDAGFVFTQQSPPFADPDQPPEVAPPPEVVPEDASIAAESEDRSPMSPSERFAADLAAQKAVSMVRAVPANFRGLILAADTLCVSMSASHEGKLIGKPRDRADAEAMLLGFMNGAHAVVSGVALLEVGSQQRAATVTRLADTAVVTFGQVADDDLQRYLDTNDWQGKAGGYNLFDRQRAGWPITVEGDPTTVVGLPMGKVVLALARYGFGSGQNFRDIDKIIFAVRAEVPGIKVEQLKITHPADDDGLWFFQKASGRDEIQLESSDGQCPFLIESTYGNKRTTALTIEQATKIIRELFHS